MPNKPKTNLTIQVEIDLLRQFKAICALEGKSLTKQITDAIIKICQESNTGVTLPPVETPEELCAIITKNGMKHEKH